MSEQWNMWKPFEDISGKFYLEELKQNDDELILTFANESQNLKCLIISFDSFISYRNHDEGDLLKTLNEQGSKLQHFLFMVKNSNYLQWFHQESCEVYIDKNVIHYAFATPDDVIDVLCEYPPNILRMWDA